MDSKDIEIIYNNNSNNYSSINYNSNNSVQKKFVQEFTKIKPILPFRNNHFNKHRK